MINLKLGEDEIELFEIALLELIRHEKERISTYEEERNKIIKLAQKLLNEAEESLDIID